MWAGPGTMRSSKGGLVPGLCRCLGPGLLFLLLWAAMAPAQGLPEDNVPGPDFSIQVRSRGQWVHEDVVFLRQDEPCPVFRAFPPNGPAPRWVLLEPVPGEYDLAEFKDSPRKPGQRLAISYTMRALGARGPEFQFTEHRNPGSCGVYYLTLARFTDSLPDSGLGTPEPLHREFSPRVVQIVVRRDDSYTGLLSELFHTPFILPPLRVRHGHQTDERVGSDCAEFAIYGRRRMGHAVPYVGPKGIYKYLAPVQGPPLPGDILHFGEQVTVFWQDLGEPGIIDGEDEVAESWPPGPQVKLFKESEYYGRRFRVYRWK